MGQTRVKPNLSRIIFLYSVGNCSREIKGNVVHTQLNSIFNDDTVIVLTLVSLQPPSEIKGERGIDITQLIGAHGEWVERDASWSYFNPHLSVEHHFPFELNTLVFWTDLPLRLVPFGYISTMRGKSSWHASPYQAFDNPPLKTINRNPAIHL